MSRNLRAPALSRLAATVLSDGLCFADPAAPTPPTGMTTAGSSVPLPANCVRTCAPSSGMSIVEPGVYLVTDTKTYEAITQPLYDTIAYAVAGQTSLSFFQIPISGAKTLASTNMQSPGMLPSPQKFLISGVSVDLMSSVPPVQGPRADAATCQLNDYYAVMNNLLGVNGWFHLELLSKPYLNIAPLMSLPPRGHINGGMAAATNLTTGAATQTLGAFGYSDGDVFKPIPLLVESTQNFMATVNWPAAVALPSGSTTTNMRVDLHGTLYRPPQ